MFLIQHSQWIHSNSISLKFKILTLQGRPVPRSQSRPIHSVSLQRNPNYYTWTSSRTKPRNKWQYWIYEAVSSCRSWQWGREGRKLRCFVALVKDEHFLCYYRSVYCCLIRYILVRTRIAKYFTNKRKRFKYEVMFENEHTFYSRIHHVSICRYFMQLTWAAA
jgi:hypothetical protein